jgi:hypothetical protein
MRGGSQARLIEGDDGRCYIAKFLNNPQGKRTLVNEWVAQSILTTLGISTPPLCLLRLPDSLLDDRLYFDIGNKRVPVQGEWHLGSLCPVNPETNAIFDFLPERLLRNTINLDDFARIFVADQWLHQTDKRQAIFVREHAPGASPLRMRAYFVDHGMAFDGAFWDLREASGHGWYMNRKVYEFIDMAKICSETVSQIESLSEREILSSITTLPESWLSPDDSDVLHRLLMKLHKNRLQLRRVITGHVAPLGIPTSLPRNSHTYNNGLGVIRKEMGSAQYHARVGDVRYGS